MSVRSWHEAGHWGEEQRLTSDEICKLEIPFVPPYAVALFHSRFKVRGAWEDMSLIEKIAYNTFPVHAEADVEVTVRQRIVLTNSISDAELLVCRCLDILHHCWEVVAALSILTGVLWVIEFRESLAVDINLALEPLRDCYRRLL